MARNTPMLATKERPDSQFWRILTSKNLF